MKKNILLIFIAICFLQWYVLAKMIWDHENVLRKGEVFKFKTMPIDPNDPFRGKYLTLHYEAITFEPPNIANFMYIPNEKVAILLEKDKNGFAKIATILKEKPQNDSPYVWATIEQIQQENPLTITIQYPFDKFYMEEEKAPKVEKLYNELAQDTSNVIYSLVKIKEGKAVLMDIHINGKSITDLEY